MGQEIVYCAKCGVRLKEDAFKNGQAFAISNRNWCVGCIQALLPALSEAGQARVQELMKRPEEPPKAEPLPDEPEPAATPGTSKILRPKSGVFRKPGRDGASASDRLEAHPSGSPAKVVAILLVVVILAGGAVVLIAMSGGGRSAPRNSNQANGAAEVAGPKGPEATPILNPLPGERPEGPRNPTPVQRPTPEVLRARLASIKAEAVAKPDQPPGPIVKKLRDLQWDSEGEAEIVKEVKAVLDPWEKKLKEEVGEQLQGVNREVAKLAGEKNFEAALKLLGEKRRSRSEPEWTSAVDRATTDLRSSIESEWQELERKAKQEFDPAAAAKLLEPARAWGNDYVAKADRLLQELKDAAAKPTPGPTPTPGPGPGPEPGPGPTPVRNPESEAAAHDALWTEVSGLASKREFAAAIASIRGKPESFTDANVRAKALEDLRALTLAKEMIDQSLDFLGSGAGGQDVSLRFVDPGGKRKTVRGKIVRASSARVELQGSVQGTEFVEVVEIDAETLQAVHKSRKSKDEADLERGAYFLIFEGDEKTARKAAGKAEDKIPERFWAYARGLEEARKTAKRDPPDRDMVKRELEARELFYKAERAYRNIDQVAMSIFDFKDVVSKYGDTDFVRRNKAQIEARSEGGKDWIVRASDIKSAAPLWEYKALSGAPLEKVWIAKHDAAPDNNRQNWIDFSFYTSSAPTYRVWVLANACCQETAKFFFQGTGVQAGTGQTADIGARTAMINQPPTSLPASHQHGGGQNKWQWILLMGNFSSGGGGVKKFRVMTEVGDVAISHVLISSTLTSPPRSFEELRQLENLR